MEFNLFLKFYVNLVFKVMFHLKLKLNIKCISTAALHVNIEEICFSLHILPEYFQIYVFKTFFN